MHSIFACCVLAVATLPLLPAPPSDPVAAYAVLDKVVLLPNAEQPTAVELQGAFALAEGQLGSFYRAPRCGVMHFTSGKDLAAALAQWRDLQRCAGTGKVVVFGSRYEANDAAKPRWLVQPEGAAPPANPVPWSVGLGMQVLENVNYGAARELSLLPRCLPVDLGQERRPARRPERSVVFTCTNCAASDGDLRYVFTVATSDGERFASPAIAPGKGLTTWTTQLALQVGERVTWSVHVVGSQVERAPVDVAEFVVPAAAVERK